MKTELVSQYKNALRMLANVIELCPEKLWDDTVNYGHLLADGISYAFLYRAVPMNMPTALHHGKSMRRIITV